MKHDISDFQYIAKNFADMSLKKNIKRKNACDLAFIHNLRSMYKQGPQTLMCINIINFHVKLDVKSVETCFI